MVDGIRAGAEGLRLMSLKLDTLAANMANASTAAYKKDSVSAGVTAGAGGESIGTAGYIDLSQGELVKTGNPLDVALEGEGFFVAGQGDAGGFTRDGRFSVDPSGRLTVAGGLPVQGARGPIVLNPSLETVITADGSVTQAGKALDRLRVVKFGDPSLLSKAGNGLLKSGEAGAEATAAVRQGFVENSNVRLVEEMASLMQVMRSFESIQKSMTSQDSATGKLIATFGKY